MGGEHVEICQAESSAELDMIRAMFQEYQEWLGLDLCFQGFQTELATLPGEYAPPRGRLWYVQSGGEAVGCIALKPISETVAEMKRLYLREAYRGRGLGRFVVERLLAEARSLGYRHVRLDTLPQMGAAIGLYRVLGFREIEPYRHNPVPGALYMELEL